MLIRQGDLILQSHSLPESIGEPRTLTLAVGEESGHSHVLFGVDRGPGLVEVLAPTALRVEGMPWRHDPITVPAGTYRYWVQRQLSESEEVVRVQD
jgi:hypothetical protein